MFFHQRLKNVGAASIWNDMMFRLVRMNKSTQRVEETVKRMLFVRADLIQQFVEARDGGIIFVFIMNRKYRCDWRPVRLEISDLRRHGFQSPRSYSACVKTCRM